MLPRFLVEAKRACYNLPAQSLTEMIEQRSVLRNEDFARSCAFSVHELGNGVDFSPP